MERIENQEGGHSNYPGFSTKGSATHDHMSYLITSTARSNKNTSTSCCRLLDTDHLQLGRGSNNQYKLLADKVQEDQIEIV